ncbi:MAG TPA: hypothetical protein VE132_05570, partial [Micromonosporaceae bacterium]|nr:hypothetical protein [Micromonosporaceae bacterium]
MTSTPEPDDRRAAPDQTADHGVADTGDAIVRPENATSDRPDDPASGAADDRSEDVVAEGVDHVDEAADDADRTEGPDAIAGAGAHDGATRAMESSGDAADADVAANTSEDAVVGEQRGPDPVDAGSARAGATGAGEAPAFDAGSARAEAAGAATG